MRGISEEKLRKVLFGHYWDSRTCDELLDSLLGECTELSPWMPIDENTPKSKEILVYDNTFGSIRAMFIYGGWRTGNVNLRNIDPTHWMPLPEPPK